MTRYKKLFLAFAIVGTLFSIVPTEAQADGPLRRWWRNLTGRNCGCQNQFARPTQYPVTANYANPYNLQPGQCMQTCQKTCTRTVVNYVPQTAYRTVYNRVPVTQYRPVTNSDPCTGCTVTCMKPCTTYTYQVQRVPYTTYRPVYRQEAYKVPVTTITNGCATGNCATGTCGMVNNGCSTCATGVATGNFGPTMAPTQGAPITEQSVIYEPANSSTTGSQFPTTVPADSVPSLNDLANPQTSQRPSYYPVQPESQYRAQKVSSPRPVYEQLSRPMDNSRPSAKPYPDYRGQTAMTPVRNAWSYTPVRMASSRTHSTYASTSSARVSTRRSGPANSRWIED